MTAIKKNKTQKKVAGSEALKRTKIQVRILGEDFDFKEKKTKTGAEKKIVAKEVRVSSLKKKKGSFEPEYSIEDEEVSRDGFLPVIEKSSIGETDTEIAKEQGVKNFLKEVGVSESEIVGRDEDVGTQEPVESLKNDIFGQEKSRETKLKKLKPLISKKAVNKTPEASGGLLTFSSLSEDREEQENNGEEETFFEAEKEEKVAKPRSIRLYRKISFFFIFLTLALVAVVLFFALVSMTVIVVPKSETVNEKMLVNIFNNKNNQESNFSQEAVAGEIARINVSEEREYKTTGAEIISREIKGTVRIINEYDYSQPLVASTRLLSPDDKLFKIKDTINIPAGGEIEVAIYTEDPSEDMAVAPTRFSIPGLPAFKQDKVYAKNDEKFVYETQVRKYVQQTDIDAGVADLKNILKSKVEEQYGGQYKGNDRVIYDIDKNSMEIIISDKVGEEASEFLIKIKAVVNVVAFKSSDIKGFAENRLRSIVPNNKKILAINEGDIEYALSNYDFNQEVATIEVSFSAQATIDNEDELVDRKKLVGLNEDQVLKFLESEEKYENFQVEFFPSFIRRSPQLVDRIKVQIGK